MPRKVITKENLDQLKLKKQAEEILVEAQKYGIEQNYFFITTFRRYQVQLKILEELEKVINDQGALVTKEYVKGRENVYTHPAIAQYNSTTDSANRTATTLMKIITTLLGDIDEEDPLKAFNSELGK